MIFNSSQDSFDVGNSLDSVFSASPFPQNAPDYSNGLNTNNYFEGSSISPEIDAAIIDTEPQNDTSLNPPFNLGFYTVGDTGKVNFDYLLNGGAYQGELAIFSLAGLGKYEIGTEAFIQETARRSLSNSESGYVVISEQTEAARYTTEDADYTTGKYEGIKTFEMNPGDQFGVMLIPDGTVEEVLENPGIIGSKQPIFSIAPMNPQKAFHIGQLKDMNNGSIWVMEDISADSGTDKDFNDFVFYMEGAAGNAPSFETLVNPVHDWLSEGVGKNLIEDESIGVLPIPNPDPNPNPQPIPEPNPDPQRIVNNGDLVEGSDERVYLIQEDKKRLIPNPGILQGNGFNTDAIKSLSDEELNNIPLGDDVAIPSQYQESVDVANNWTSDFYWWDGNGKPSIDFSDSSNNKFATLNLGSNTRSDGNKGISFDWGDGSPKDDNKLLNDNFVVRSYTQANLEKGKQYKAIVTADDGYQLFAKNQNTDKWVYFTSEDEWQEAYGGDEIILKVDETGLYDFHFQYFEKDGDAEFDLSWEEIPPLGGEPPLPPVEPPVEPPDFRLPSEYKLIIGESEKDDYMKGEDWPSGTENRLRELDESIKQIPGSFLVPSLEDLAKSTLQTLVTAGTLVKNGNPQVTSGFYQRYLDGVGEELLLGNENILTQEAREDSAFTSHFDDVQKNVKDLVQKAIDIQILEGWDINKFREQLEKKLPIENFTFGNGNLFVVIHGAQKTIVELDDLQISVNGNMSSWNATLRYILHDDFAFGFNDQGDPGNKLGKLFNEAWEELESGNWSGAVGKAVDLGKNIGQASVSGLAHFLQIEGVAKPYGLKMIFEEQISNSFEFPQELG